MNVLCLLLLQSGSSGRKKLHIYYQKKFLCLNYATFNHALFYYHKSLTNSSTIPMIG